MHCKKKRKLVQSFWIALLQLNQPTTDHYPTPAECRMLGVLLGAKHEQNRQKSKPVPSGEMDVKVIKDQVARIKARKCGEETHTMITRDLARTSACTKAAPYLTPAHAKSTAVKTSVIAITFTVSTSYT